MPRNRLTLSIALLIGSAVALAACSRAPESPSPKTSPAAAAASATASAATVDHGGIAWREGDVDAAFASARTEGKPLFLYWGAIWCPPCNQVKATIFNRQDFIDRARFFIPVYLDGDTRSAQRLGARFNVSGYPTMILFAPDGRELTRLPGEVDAEQYMSLLALGMSGARPVKDTLAVALSGSTSRAGWKLSPDDWRMLAYYSWFTDEQQLVPTRELPGMLKRLAQNCPADQRETASRLELKAVAAAATAKGAKPTPDAEATARVLAAVTDNKLARENFDTLTEYPGEIVGFLTAPDSPERARLAAAWTAALDRLIADRTLSTADRLAAIKGVVSLARLDSKGPLPPALLDRVREQVASADRTTADPYARQAVIDAAADALTEAGLLDESDALLKAELSRSHSPYYFMVDLAENAKKRGDKTAALGWYARSYASAEGPATRLQWGVRYVNALIDLSPDDAGAIERAAQSVVGELDPVPDTFYERNLRGLDRMGQKLSTWGKEPARAATLARIRAQMSEVCAKLPAGDPARAKCGAALRPRAPTA